MSGPPTSGGGEGGGRPQGHQCMPEQARQDLKLKVELYPTGSPHCIQYMQEFGLFSQVYSDTAEDYQRVSPTKMETKIDYWIWVSWKTVA